MNRYLFRFIQDLKIRWKMVVVVLPLVLVPLMLVGAVTGYIAYRQAQRGITQAAMDDLDHMARFTIDLLDAHHQQFQVYRQDKKETVEAELRTLVDLAYGLVEAQQHQAHSGALPRAEAQEAARRALKRVQVGESGYIYAMTTGGRLTVHIAREGETILGERDEEGRFFIRTMIDEVRSSLPGDTFTIIYPWRNPELGDIAPRQKMVAYRYFEPWDWIIAAGGYLEETYEDPAVEREAFAALQAKIQNKKVGRTGYIYCMDRQGTLTVHPEAEGENILEVRDSNGTPFIRRMLERREGWIWYPWRNVGEPEARRKIVRYLHFEPWDWIVAVGSYEEEFYRETRQIKGRILASLGGISVVVALLAVALVFMAAKVLSDPIQQMTAVIRDVKRGHFNRQMEIDSRDELGELAAAFNRMTRFIQRTRELESNLAQQGKMASLGVLSSGVAHEINNPLGVILGYAGYLEKKLDPDDPHYPFIHEIKRESKRCKKIVQDLLNFARTPKPEFAPVDLNRLLDQIADFATHHTDLHRVEMRREFDRTLPEIPLDGDQIRQVAINLILNAGAAMAGGGTLTLRTRREGDHVVAEFEDDGQGIPEDVQERIFEPFFTTRERGTGLGLAITRQIIEQHHGQIELTSQPGEGTTVRVRLPLAREEI